MHLPATGRRVPAALFLIDIGHEHIALAEAKRLGVTTFGIVDTNCDPDLVDFPVAGNDDAIRSIKLISSLIAEAILEGKGVIKPTAESRPRLMFSVMPRNLPSGVSSTRQRNWRSGSVSTMPRIVSGRRRPPPIRRSASPTATTVRNRPSARPSTTASPW